MHRLPILSIEITCEKNRPEKQEAASIIIIIMSAFDTATKALVCSILVIMAAIEYDKYLNRAKKGHPHAGLDLHNLIEAYGYPAEIHEVTTEDGYILRLHRIPHGKDGKEENITRKAVLLAHCLACTASAFLTAGANISLATLLSDEGYDVWLFNARGSRWSRRHARLNPNRHSEYWNFTWHEIGIYDLPESIDHILETTKQKDLYYVGMSQGATIFFVMMSEKPKYNEKIRFMTALAPAPPFDTPSGPVLRMLTRVRFIYTILRYIGIHEQFNYAGFALDLMRTFCDKDSLFLSMCLNGHASMVGYNEKELDEYQLPVIFSETPAGCSTKQIEHFLQVIATKNFTKFDYGTQGNLEIYKQETPPFYDLSKIKVPVSLYYSEGDWIISTAGVKRLSKMLPNVVKEYIVPDKQFTHNDFLYAIHARELVYWSVVDDLKTT